MKSRFLSCPLTLEDFEIWDRLSEPRFLEGAPFEDGVPLNGYCEAHLRDVDLTYQAQLYPFISGTYTESGELVELRGRLTSYRRAGLV